MPLVKPDTTIKEYQEFVKDGYGLPDDRYFSANDMMVNIERFLTRGLKGIRKGDLEKTKVNLMISLSWFMSLMNQMHIDVEEEIWKRFPYLCSYCGTCPCSCKAQKIQTRQGVKIDNDKRPKTLKEYQEMFNMIYPAKSRTLAIAGVHLAEEVGELAEKMLAFRGRHEDSDFTHVCIEAADLLSCFLATFNSLDVDLSKELSTIFFDNCHKCHDAPCTCTFTDIANFKS